MSLNPNGAPAGFYYQAGATAYLIDPAGTYSLAGASAPTIDPAGAYSFAGASAPTLAAAGAYIPITGATSVAAEIVEPATSHSLAGASSPTTGPAGTDRGAGASAPTPPDPGGPIPITGATSAAGEIVDSAEQYSGASAPTTDLAGRRSAAGASAPMLAPASAYISVIGATSSAAEIVDPAGAYSLAGASAPTADPAGRHSAVGAGAPTLAAPDASTPVTGGTSAAAEIVSPPGMYLPPGATAPTADPEGTYSAAGASAPTMDPAGTYSSPYALNRLFVIWEKTAPSYAVLSFHSATAVANYFGATSNQATLATEFFAGYAGTSATMSFTRFGLGQRPHLLGANLSKLTPTQLQGINGSLALTFDGYTYSAPINLSGVGSSKDDFKNAASVIQTALNSNLLVAAVMTGSSITPESVSFTANADNDQLSVTSVSSGSIEIGGIISGPGIRPSQIINQLSGTPGGPGQYATFSFPLAGGGVVPSEKMTETYGVLKVGAVNSGTVALGQEVASADIPPLTGIEYNLSGDGPGSTWIVNNAPAQTVTGDITTTAPPLLVNWNGNNNPIIGATENNDFFEIMPNGSFGFDQNPSSLSYASGTAAAALRLTQKREAIDSSPGGQEPTTAQYMDDTVSGYGQFGSFETDIPRAAPALAAWAQSTGYKFIPTLAAKSTPPAGSSLPTKDPAGTYSGRGASAPTPAAPGWYIPVPGATSARAEIEDPAGSYSLAGASAPTLAQPGYYVPTPGMSYETPDDPGYYTPYVGATAERLVQAPVISGTVRGQSTPSGQPDTPFSLVTITDPNELTSDSLSIQITGGGGKLSDGAGFSGLTESAAGVYLLSGTAAAITSELHALVFTPNTFSATTTFTLTDTTSRGTSASDANTTVTVTNGEPVYSVSYFLAHRGKLDHIPGGFDILDSAGAITAKLNKLKDSHIDAVAISDNGNVGASVEQLTTDKTAIVKLQNANLSRVLLAINDTTADIEAGLSTLVQEAGEIASITASDDPIDFSAATFLADRAALDKLVGGFDVSDTAATVMADLEHLDDPNISTITISDSGQITASVAQLTADASAIGKLKNANGSPVVLAIHDMAGDVQCGLSTLVQDTGEIGSITTSNGRIVISAATFLADQSTLDKIAEGFDVSVAAANLVAALSTLNADSRVATITADIGEATLMGGVGVKAPSFSETGWGTSLTVSEALAYAGAFSQGLGSTTAITRGDTLSLTGTASLSGTTSGAGKLALAGGSATIDSSATISVSNWSISGAGTDVTLDRNLIYAGSFSEGADDTFVLSGGDLALSSAATFTGGTVDGSNFLYTEGTTTVSGLTIGGTVEWENTAGVTQSDGTVTIGGSSGDEAILFNTLKAIYDIEDDSGIDQGSSTASYIENKGRIEKTDGTGVSTIVPGVTNDGKIEVTSGTLDFGGGISGTGADTISGASTLELDAEVSADQTVHFTGSGGELALHKPGEFAGDISGFDTARAGSNDTIEVAEHWVFTGFSPGSGQGTLGFKNVSSSSVISLTLAGDYNPADFVHQTQANGSTLITYNGVSGLDTLLPFAGTHAGELDIGRGATGSGRLDLGSGASCSVGHGPGPSS